MGEKDAKRAKTTAEALKAEAPATGAGGKGLAEQPSAMQVDAQVSPGQGFRPRDDDDDDDDEQQQQQQWEEEGFGI